MQYWLEQNTRMLEATIQALEVQRMTLATLKTMNVQMGDLRNTLMIKPAEPAPAAAAAVAAPQDEAQAARAARGAKKAVPKPGNAVDPMQWWGALTTQFTQLAANAMKEAIPDASKTFAGTMVKQSLDAAAETMKGVAAAPAHAVAKAGGRAPARKRATARRRSAPTR